MKFLSHPEISLDMAVEGGHEESLDKMPPTILQSFVSTRAQTMLNSHNNSQDFELNLNNSNTLFQERQQNTVLSTIKENLDFKVDMKRQLFEQ